MNPILINLAKQAAVPLIQNILSNKLGASSPKLVDAVLGSIAEKSGVMPASLPSLAVDSPDDVTRAMLKVENEMPELIALYADGVERQFSLLQAEQKGPLWMWAWRPLGMYGFGFLWIWNLFLLHIVNGIWKLDLPQSDLGQLFQLNAIYMGLYMGGHTVKDFVKTRWGGA